MRWPLAGIGCLIVGFATGGAGRWVVERSEAASSEPGSVSAGGEAMGTAERAGASEKSAGVFEIPAIPGDAPRLSVDDLLKLSGFELTDRLARWLPGATVEELARLVRPPGDADHNIDAEGAIYRRWAELDPEGAVRFATAKGYSAPAWWARGQVDPDSALVAAAKNPRSEDLALVLRSIAQHEPAKARALGEKFPEAFHSLSVQEALAEKLERSDPRAALETAARAGSWNAQQIMSRWAAKDPDAAFEYAPTARPW